MITYADASQAIKYKMKYVNGKLVVEVLPNANNPGGCDKARAKIEQDMDLSGDVESVVSRHPAEEKLMTPEPAQIEQIKQIQKADQ